MHRFTWGFETTCSISQCPFSTLLNRVLADFQIRADGTPYLLQLGLSKSRTSAVWIAGPLSGIIMQPLVGVFADSSTSKYGRRRPYMLGGALVVVLSLGALGWAAELVGLVIAEESAVSVMGETVARVGCTGRSRTDLRGVLKKNFWTVVVAVGSIYAIDFSINVGKRYVRIERHND